MIRKETEGSLILLKIDKKYSWYLFIIILFSYFFHTDVKLSRINFHFLVKYSILPGRYKKRYKR